MFRRLAIICGILFLAGLGPALAADIFVRPQEGGKSSSAESEESGHPARLPVFNVPPSFHSEKPSDTGQEVLYQDKRDTAALKQNSLARIKTLEDWEASGREPQTEEEILAYASASRAVEQNLMYKRHEKLVAYMERKERQKAIRLAKQKEERLVLKKANQTQEKAGDISPSQKPHHGEEEKKEPAQSQSLQDSQLKKEPVPLYVNPESSASSRKVFE